MSKLPTKFFTVLAIAIAFLMLYLQPLGAKAILSNSTPTNPIKQSVLIATAAIALPTQINLVIKRRVCTSQTVALLRCIKSSHRSSLLIDGVSFILFEQIG